MRWSHPNEPSSRVSGTPAALALLILVLGLSSCADEPTAPEAPSAADRAAADGQGRPGFVPGQYIVTFRPDVPVPDDLVDRLADRHGLQVRHRYDNVFAGFSAVVPDAAVPALRRHPLIASVEPTGILYIESPVADPTLAAVPGAGLRLRLVADQLALPDGAPVGYWPNLGGTEASAVQGDAARRPTYHAAGATGRFGGHAHVGFNEVEADEYLQVDSVSPHGSATLVAVFSQDDRAAHNYGLLAFYDNAIDRGTFLTMFTGTGEPLGYWDRSIGLHASTFSPTAGAEHIAVWRIDGSTSIDFQVDGVSHGSAAISSDIHPLFSRYLVGAAEPGSPHRFSGQVAEIVLYDRALADCERDQVVAELGAWYGVDVGALDGAGCQPPDAPAGLTATAPDAWSVDLAWIDASDDEDGFHVERSVDGGATFQPVASPGPGSTAYTDRGLAAATPYCYRVAAYNAHGASAYTAVQCATTGPAPPPAPAIDVPGQGLRLRLVAGQLSLADGAEVDAWPNLGGAEGDAVQPDPARRPSFHAAGATGLFGGRAHVGFNEGDVDELLEVTGVTRHGSATLVAVFAQDDKAAHNYGLLAVYGDAANRGTFATMFTGSGDLLGYWDFSVGLQKSTFSPTLGGPHVAVWRVDGANVVDFQVDGVDHGSVAIASEMHHTFGRYLVGAAEPSGNNPFAGQLAELVLYDRALTDCERGALVADLGAEYGVPVSAAGTTCSLPAPPTGLTAAAADHRSVDLAWTDASADEDGFRVERRTGQGGSFELVAETGPSAQAFTDAGLAAETEYCYRVAAFNGDGASAFTTVQCATTDPAPPPPPAITVPSQGLRLRLVASQLPLADGAAVDVWPNLGGAEGDAVQADPGRRPTFHAMGATGLFGGRAHVGFNEGDVDEFLDVTGVTPHGSATLVAVFSQSDRAGHNYGLMAIYENATNRGTFATMFTGSGDLLGYWDFSIGLQKSTFSPTAGGEHVAVWRIDGSNRLDFQVDGVAHGSVAIASDMHPVFSRYLVGAPEPNGTNPFDGQVAELVLYDRPLSDCERDQLVGDLGAEYGIDVGGVGSGCAPPAAPAGLTATAVDFQSIDLAWTDASANETGFVVERRQGPTGAFQEVARPAADAVAYTDDRLPAGTEFCYRVAAFNDDGASDFTAIQCAITAPAPPKAAPIDVPSDGLRLRLVANELALADGDPVAAWPNLGGSQGDAAQGDATRRPTFHAAGATGLFGGQAHVGFNEGEVDEFLEVTGVAPHASATLVAVFSQTDKAAHNYGLMAVYGDAANRGTFATMFSGSGDLLGYWDFSVGLQKSTFSPTAGGQHVAVWRIRGSDVIEFQVDGVDQGALPIASDLHPVFDRYLVGAPEPTGVNPFDGQLAELVLYDRPLLDCERDQVVGDLGTQYGIPVGGIGTVACDPPAPASSLVATTVDYHTIDLAWTDGSDNEDGFRVEYRDDPAGAFQSLVDLAPGTTTHTDSTVTALTQRCYRVVAFNGDGEAAPSNVACDTTPEPPPGVCVDAGNHDDLSQLWNISRVQADRNRHWLASQVPGCQIRTWIFVLDSGLDSDHGDLNVAGVRNFVLSEPARDGEDGNGHGTHVAGSAAALDGNGGVVGVAPGAPLYGYRVCTDDGSCQEDDILAAMDRVTALKLANPDQPMVGNMSLAGAVTPSIDTAIRASINVGVVYAVGAGNGLLGACWFPADAQTVSPAGVGDDAINAQNGSDGNTARVNGVLTTTLSTPGDDDGNCNYGNPVTIAAPGRDILSTWLDDGYNVISGSSMATPHAAGAAALYLQEFPSATPAEVEAWIVGQLDPWFTDDLPNADGRLNVRRP